MEFVIDKNDLVRELQTVTGVVEKRSTIPILANLLLEAKKGRLHLGASDLEVTIRSTATANVATDGSVTLPAGKLLEIARSLPDAEVKFKLLDRHAVNISCKRTKYKIPGQSREEFPNFPDIDLETGVKLPAHKVSQLIERVIFSITTEDPRYSLNGALFLIEDGKLTMVATDSHRLAYASTPIDLKVPGGEMKVIVPRKALGEIAKMTSDLSDDDEVIFGKTGTQAFFVIGGYRLTTNVLEGNFPNYTNVMPEDCDTTVMIPTADFNHAVRRVSLLASDRYGRAVRLALSANKLHLSSKTEVGEAQESIDIEYDGPEMHIGFNARYLLEFFGVVGTSRVSLELNPVRTGEQAAKSEASDKPGQLKPDPAGDISYRYIVMPMHL
jgi:DNA polymerase-3 subunit beta